MKALLFPGQGSQIVGMGSDFFNKYNLVKKIFKQADDKLDFKLSDIILNGPKEKLQLTQITQPAIFTVSYSIFKVLKEELGIKINSFKYFAGHSLGEYSALACSNAISFEDGLYLLNERGKAMQDAVPVGKGMMLAIIGVEINKIEEILKNDSEKGVCEIANDNSEGQVIVSGEKVKVNKLQKILKDKSIRSLPLPVSAPFHCSLMKTAAESLKSKVINTNFVKPLVNIISNVTAQPEYEPERIKELLITQIYSKVRWRETILYMKEKNVNEFIEIGPGKVLTGIIKRMLKSNIIKNINSVEDMKELKE